jgi:hypothetical protein
MSLVEYLTPDVLNAVDFNRLHEPPPKKSGGSWKPRTLSTLP